MHRSYVEAGVWNNAVLCAGYTEAEYNAMTADRHRFRVFRLGIIAFFIKLLNDPDICQQRRLVLIEM